MMLVYRLQKNLVDMMTYVTMFPQLIAGPIVRYTAVETHLQKREVHLIDWSIGIKRLVQGLAKKILLANTLGELILMVQKEPPSIMAYWLVAVAFTLQIYFDFSGYSDMAIGLGRLLGFHFPENFNYPLAAKSISEFWRRWHMSLGSWFRDYVYIPLGGSRNGFMSTLRNLVVVWLLTGFWHGGSLNFILWGLMFFILIALEKWVFQPEQLGIFAHGYVVLMVIMSFVLFATEDPFVLMQTLKGMLGFSAIPLTTPTVGYAMNSYASILILTLST